MKSLFFSILLSVLLASAAQAFVDVTYNVNTINVRALAYNCQDASCSQVSSFSGTFPNGQPTSNGQLTVRYPSTLASSQGYALF